MTTNEPNTPPLDKRRVLLYALTPVFLLALLTVGMRMASDAARHQTLQAEARDQEALKKSRTSGSQAPRVALHAPVMHPADKGTQKNIEAAVRGQLFALRDGNYRKALDFSIPEYRTHTTPEQFGQMIRSGYSPMLDAKDVALKQARVMDGPNHLARANVEAIVHVANGNSIYYSYSLMKSDGAWGVQGVMGHAPMNMPMGNDESPVQPRQEPQGGPPEPENGAP